MVAILREIQIAEDGVIRALGRESQCFLKRGGTVHVQVASSEPFKEQGEEAFFIVEHEKGTAFQDVQWSGRRGAGRKRGDRERSGGRLVGSGGEINRECGAARGESFGFDRAAVLANDGQADAETEAGAPAGALGGVKGIEKARDGIGTNANAVVLEGDGDARAYASKTNLDAARFTDFADGLLGVGDQIEKDLNELVGVGNDSWKIGLRTEIHFDVISAERVFMQLEGAVYDAIEIDRFFLRRGRPGKLEKILNDASGAACLAMGQFELAFDGFFETLAFAE